MERAKGHEPESPIDVFRRVAQHWAIDCGGRVRAARRARGWSLLELADRVGTTEATIHRIEHGVLQPRDHMKLAVAAALEAPAAELWPLPAADLAVAS
jgi:transcriptional regulator with XRE-family HTH domain